MTDYYFDIETASKDPNDPNRKANCDPKTGKIITIQYQKVDPETGVPTEPLTILKEWENEHSERIILEKFKPLITGNCWEFIPLGYNLWFEFKFLKQKFNEYFNIDFPAEDFIGRPKNDLQLIGVILNKGEFKGAKLNSFTDKEHDGSKIPIWYWERKYDAIVDYVVKESDAFLKFWQEIKSQLPQMFGKKTMQT
jgi:hypothetical protein